METENQEAQKKSTDPQQAEIDGNVLGGIFEDVAGDTKGRQDTDDEPSTSQTGGVDEEKEKGHS